MDRNMEFAGYPGSNFDNGFDNDIYKDPMFNPMLQYEQAYMYYRYLTQQVEYKIKCKELDKISKTEGRGDRRIE